MEVTRVIIKKQVPITNKIAATSIISALNIKEVTTLLNKPDKTLEDSTKIARYILDLDNAAKLMGFKNCQDFTDFAKIYGVEAIM